METMIKSFTPRPFDGLNQVPSYASNVKAYTLTGTVAVGGGLPYVITLAKLSIGDSISAGNQLAHASFESFNDHGERMATARTRMNGHEREFSAVKNAMMDAGIEFAPVTPCEPEKLLEGLGDWFREQNPDIKEYHILSQSRH